MTKKMIILLSFFIVLIAGIAGYKYYSGYQLGKSLGKTMIYHGSNPDLLLKYFGNEKGKISFMSKKGCGMFGSLAAYNPHPQMVEAALKAGASYNINCSIKNGVTPLMAASMYNSNPQIALILITTNANINAVDAFGQTALMAATANKTASYDISRELIKAGADLNIADKLGHTALAYAAKYNKNPKLITLLVQAGANINARDNKGQTALDIAYKYKAPQDVIDALLKAGAD